MKSISRWYEELESNEKTEQYITYCKEKATSAVTWLLTFLLMVYSYLETIANSLYRKYVAPHVKKDERPIRQIFVANPDANTEVESRIKQPINWEEAESMVFQPEDTVYVEFSIPKKSSSEQNLSSGTAEVVVDVAMAVFKSEDQQIPKIKKKLCTINTDYDELSVLGLECYPDASNQSKKEDITDMYHLYQKCGYGGDKTQMPALRYLDLVEPQKGRFIVSMGSELQMIDGDAMSHQFKATDYILGSAPSDSVEDNDESKSSIELTK
jgi:hypothetical protein